MRCILFGCLLLVLLPWPVLSQDKGPAKGKAGKLPGKVNLAVNTGGHSSPVVDLDFTGDGKKLVSLENREVHVWDVASGERVRTWRLPYYQLDKLAVSPDGRTVAVAGAVNAERDLPIWLLNLETGDAQVVQPKIGYTVYGLHFSPDSKRLAWATWYQAGVWDLKKGRVSHLVKRDGQTYQASFVKDSSHLLLGGGVAKGSQYQIFDLPAAKPKLAHKLETPAFPLTGFPGWHETAAAAPDGSRFAVWDRETHQIHLWGADGKKEKKTDGSPRTVALGALPHVHQMQFMDPDTLIAAGVTGSDQVKAVVINLKAPKKRKTHEWHYQLREPLRLTVAPNGKYLAVNTGPGFQVLLCDLESGTSRRLGAPFPPPVTLGWSPDSRAIGWRFSRPDPKKPGLQLTGGLNLATLQLVEREQLKDFKDDLPIPAGWKIKGEGSEVRKDKSVGVSLFHKGKRIETEVRGPLRGFTFFKNAAGEQRVLISARWGHEPLHVVDAETGKSLRHYDRTEEFAISPDKRFVLLTRGEQVLEIHKLEGKGGLLLRVLVAGRDWIAWTPQGYFASTPSAERLMGWTLRTSDTQPLIFYPADRFSKRLYRPEVIRKAFELQSAQAAVKSVEGARGIVQVDDLLPPSCTIRILKEDGQKVSVQVKATAQVKTQPVVALRLLLDGRPLPADGGLKEFDKGKAEAEAVFTVELAAGKHTLSALARSEDASGLATPLTWERVVAAKLPVLHLLAIGINDYRNGVPPLKCAVNDARDLTKVFPIVKQGNIFSEVKTHLLLDGEATVAGIRKKLAELRPQVKHDDVLVLSFAGHGVREGQDFLLLTAEADMKDLKQTSLSGQELSRLLRDLQGQVLLLLDACHSGAIIANRRHANEDAARALADDEVGVTVLAAARGHQKALEANGNGYFTAAIKEALEGKKGVPTSRDHRLFVRHLYAYVVDVVAQRSDERQHPLLSEPSSSVPYPLRQFAGK